MIARGLYYTNSDFKTMIQNVGGKWNHRTPEQQARINKYMSKPDSDIRSCFYHVGRTSAKSIFFISDAIPITEKYIDSIHVGGDGKHYIIKNAPLLKELERKLFRVLSSENANPNSFRQHIFDVKQHLLKELENDRKTKNELSVKDATN